MIFDSNVGKYENNNKYIGFINAIFYSNLIFEINLL